MCFPYNIVVLFILLLLLKPHHVNSVGEESNECTTNKDNKDKGSTASCSLCLDSNDVVCQERNNECDSDPSFMLISCPKTCMVCFDDNNNVLPQDAGLGKLPLEISIQVLQVMRRTNTYNKLLSKPEYALVRGEYCKDESTMCAFWAFQGQCTNPDYAEYMQHTCPLTCQHCSTSSELDRGRAFLSFLLNDLNEAYYQSGTNNDVSTSRCASLSLLMTRLGMNPDELLLGCSDGTTQPSSNTMEQNWVLELHSRLHAIIPPVLLRLYKSLDDISDQDVALLAELHNMPLHHNNNGRDDMFLSRSMIPYRGRGYIVSLLQALDHLVTRPIQLQVGFAIPNAAALQGIQSLNRSILYMGAGTGYWAAMMRRQQQQENMLAYDLNPPAQGKNVFFDTGSYYDNGMKEGSCRSVLESQPQLARDYALMLVWPNDPDPIDNRQFCANDDGCEVSQPVWDADCLELYLQAGGTTVIYVGERETALSRISSSSLSDCGLSSTRRFQQLLQSNFALKERIAIPNWWLNEDDVTFWERKQ